MITLLLHLNFMSWLLTLPPAQRDYALDRYCRRLLGTKQ